MNAPLKRFLVSRDELIHLFIHTFLYKLTLQNLCVCVCVCVHSVMSYFVTPWTIVCQAPLSKGFTRREYWSGLPFPPPEDLPHLGTELVPLVTPALADGFLTTSATK